MIIKIILCNLVIIGTDILKFDDDPIKYEEKYEKVKGIVSSIRNDGARIITSNVFYLSGNRYLKNNIFEEYQGREIVCKENASFFNYMDLSEMKFEDIEEGDILFYDGNIEWILKNLRRVDANDNVYILKSNDLHRMAEEYYKGMRELKNVDLVGYADYTDDIEKYHVNYLWGRFKFKTFRGDELPTIFGFKISDDTVIEEGENNKYADIILKNNFEDTIGDVREIEKIKYK